MDPILQKSNATINLYLMYSQVQGNFYQLTFFDLVI